MQSLFLRQTGRRLLRQKSISLINTFGLAIGLAACLLLYLYVQNQLNYDAYNKNAPRIVRVTSIVRSPESNLAIAGSPAALAPVLLKEFPQLESAVRIGPADLSIREGSDMVAARNFFYSEPAIFSIFSFTFLEGSQSALDQPHSIILTRSAARHYLGSGPAIGRVIVAGGENYRVSAVIEDRPANSDLTIDALLSKDFSKSTWVDTDFDVYTFLLFRGQPDLGRLNSRINDVTARYTQPELDRQGIPEYHFYFEAERLTDVHFSKGKLEDTPKGNRQFLAIFSILAVFILLIALLNYINLSTAKATERAKEIGVRKVIGAGPRRLIGQFLAESALLVAIAWALAFGLLLGAIPLFNRLLSTQLSLDRSKTLLFAVIFFPLTTLLAGGYPALVLSRFSPVRVFRGRPEKEGKSVVLRKLLTVTQFVIALVMLSGTAIIMRQMEFIKHKDLGADRSGIITINIPADSAVRAKAPAFIAALRHETAIRALSVGSGLPSEGVQMASTTGYTDGKKRILMVNYFFIDPDLLPMLHIPLVRGRNFSENLLTDHKTTPPLAVLIKTVPQQLPRLAQLWKTHFPATPYSYYFLAEDFEKQYEKDKTTMALFNSFTVLALFICFIGLYGLVSLLVIRRIKEIGIRKVLGASLAQLLALLSKDLVLLVGWAAAIALPLAGIGGHHWLAAYAYHAELSWEIFLWPLLTLLTLTLLIAGIRILRAALANPTAALRSE